MELSYLHPNYFIPDSTIYQDLKIDKNKKYILIRFVSWEASHDIGKNRLDYNTKIKLVSKLSEHFKIFVSSENELPKEIQKFSIKINPERMHHVLYYSSLFVGEGATMASECAMLGTPSIYVNSLQCSTCDEQENKYQLLFNFRNIHGVVEKAFDILKKYDRKEFLKRRETMINDKIDVTEFMVWFVENFPDSFKITKKQNYEKLK
jgi:hypothetical protein